MKRAVIFGRPVDMQGSPMTLLYYRNEFGVEADLYSDYAKACSEYADITTILQIAWSMAKTVDPLKVPDFVSWVGEFDASKFSLAGLDAKGSWVSEVIEAFNAELFRDLTTEKAAQR